VSKLSHGIDCITVKLFLLFELLGLRGVSRKKNCCFGLKGVAVKVLICCGGNCLNFDMRRCFCNEICDGDLIDDRRSWGFTLVK
jgi:hypothetical protein